MGASGTAAPAPSPSGGGSGGIKKPAKSPVAGGGYKRIKKSGALTPSVDRLSRTQVKWMGVDLPSKKTNYGASTVPVEMLAKKEFAHKSAKPGLPLLIYFVAETDDDKKAKDYRDRLWRDEYVGLSSQLFNCYRISLEDIELDSDRRLYGKKPRVQIYSPDGKLMADMKGWKLKKQKLFSNIRRTVKKLWKKEMTGLIGKEAPMLFALDRIARDMEIAKVTLSGAKAHLKEHATCNAAEKNIRRSKAEIKELTKEKAEIEAKREALYSFAIKPKAKAKSKTELKEKPTKESNGKAKAETAKTSS